MLRPLGLCGANWGVPLWVCAAWCFKPTGNCAPLPARSVCGAGRPGLRIAFAILKIKTNSLKETWKTRSVSDWWFWGRGAAVPLAWPLHKLGVAACEWWRCWPRRLVLRYLLWVWTRCSQATHLAWLRLVAADQPAWCCFWGTRQGPGWPIQMQTLRLDRSKRFQLCFVHVRSTEFHCDLQL